MYIFKIGDQYIKNIDLELTDKQEEAVRVSGKVTAEYFREQTQFNFKQKVEPVYVKQTI